MLKRVRGELKHRSMAAAKRLLERVRDRTDEIFVAVRCPRCGGEMVVRTGRFGAIRACRRYPECSGKIATYYKSKI